jgi:molecular chaperone DnaJ
MFERPEWLEEDYYAVLGVATNASSREVDCAMRRAIAAAGGSESVSPEVQEAYRVLGDSGRRVEYDGMRKAAALGQQVELVPSGGSRYCRAGFAAAGA